MSNKTIEKDKILKYYHPLVGMTSVDYYLPKECLDMVSELRKDVEKFFDKTKPDDLNGSMFDERINVIFALAKNEVDKQKTKHLVAMNGMRQNLQAAKLEVEKNLAKIEMMIEENRTELSNL